MTDPTFDRFMAKVQMTRRCWLWTGAKDRKGYGQFRVLTKLTRAHRWAWRAWNGPIPKGLVVCHFCDTPSCVRPDHLFLGTASENQRDCVAKKRHASQKKTECAKGHPLSGENLYLCPRGYRECKTCRRQNVRRHRA